MIGHISNGRSDSTGKAGGCQHQWRGLSEVFLLEAVNVD
jgi:hypothetical protein